MTLFEVIGKQAANSVITKLANPMLGPGANANGIGSVHLDPATLKALLPAILAVGGAGLGGLEGAGRAGFDGMFRGAGQGAIHGGSIGLGSLLGGGLGAALSNNSRLGTSLGSGLGAGLGFLGANSLFSRSNEIKDRQEAQELKKLREIDEAAATGL